MDKDIFQLMKKKSEDNVQKYKNLIDEFIKKYDQASTLFFIAKKFYLQEEREFPVVNYLFNRYLAIKPSGSAKPSCLTIKKLYKYLEEYSKACIETTVSANNDFSTIQSRQHITNLVNPEIYPQQLMEKVFLTFENINQDFFIEFGFHPLQALKFALSINSLYIQRFKKNCPDILFTAEQLYEFDNELSSKQNKEELEKYLNALSINADSFQHNYESLLDKDISQEKPFLKKQSQYLGINLAQNHYSFCNQLELLLKERGGKLYEQYTVAKSKYAENLAYTKMQTLFQGHNIYQNLEYTNNEGEVEGEVDILIEYDNKIILVEVKSSSVTYQPNKEIRRKLSRQLKKIIPDAYKQAQRASEYILKSEQPKFYRKDNPEKLINIHKSEYLEILIICISTENLMAITQNLNTAKLNNWPENVTYPWAVNLLELDIILNHIKYPSLFIHYIKSRLVAQGDDVIFAQDELSYFSMYLQTPFGGFQFNKEASFVMINPQMLKPIDDYYTVLSSTPLNINLDSRLERFIKEYEQLIIKKYFVGFSELLSMLLSMNGETGKNFFDRVEEMTTKTEGDQKLHSFCMVCDDTIFIFCSMNNRTDLENQLIHYATIKKYDFKLDNLLALGKDTSSNYLIDFCYSKNEPYEKTEEMDRALFNFQKYQMLQKK